MKQQVGGSTAELSSAQRLAVAAKSLRDFSGAAPYSSHLQRIIIRNSSFIIHNLILVPLTAGYCIHINALCFVSLTDKSKQSNDKSGHKKCK